MGSRKSTTKAEDSEQQPTRKSMRLQGKEESKPQPEKEKAPLEGKKAKEVVKAKLAEEKKEEPTEE